MVTRFSRSWNRVYVCVVMASEVFCHGGLLHHTATFFLAAGKVCLLMASQVFYYGDLLQRKRNKFEVCA